MSTVEIEILCHLLLITRSQQFNDRDDSVEYQSRDFMIFYDALKFDSICIKCM